MYLVISNVSPQPPSPTTSVCDPVEEECSAVTTIKGGGTVATRLADNLSNKNNTGGAGLDSGSGFPREWSPMKIQKMGPFLHLVLSTVAGI